MRVVRYLAIALLTLAVPVVPTYAVAQNVEDEVAQAARALFDAMRAGDGAAVEALFHPDVRLMIVSVQDGRAVVASTSPADFARAVGNPRTEVWDERIGQLSIQVDGGLATAWMNYAFYLDDRFSHCGINAFQFIRSDTGWQILQLTYTRRQDSCGPVESGG